MAVIYMKHQKHGTKVACSEEEAKYDEKLGWERYTLETSRTVTPAPEASASVALDDELASLRKQYKERFGKIPHHKKSVSTLRAELAA